MGADCPTMHWFHGLEQLSINLGKIALEPLSAKEAGLLVVLLYFHSVDQGLHKADSGFH